MWLQSTFWMWLSLAFLPGCLCASSSHVLVSGYSNQMAVYNLSSAGLQWVTTWGVELNMSWIQFQGGALWALHEVTEFHGSAGGAVSRWEMEKGRPVIKEWLSTGSPGPAHLLVDLVHGLVLTANYAGSSLTVFSLTSQGSLDRLVQTETYGPGCRDASHPHESIRKGDLVWVTDLGCDTIYHYRIVADRLVRIGSTAVERGAGPRHIALHPNKNLAFLVCELKSLLVVYSVNYTSGDLSLLQLVSVSSVAGNAGAEVLISESGEMVYVSSRGVGMVLVYRLTGSELVKEQEYQLAGTWPRSIALQDGVLLAADQKGNRVQVVEVDTTTGHLLPGNNTAPTPPQPAFVTFFPWT